MDRTKYKTIGYARASTSTSKFGLEAHVAALVEDGCDQIFKEVISRQVKDSERPQPQAALAALEEDSELVLCKLERGFRTQKETINVLYDLKNRTNIYAPLMDL